MKTKKKPPIGLMPRWRWVEMNNIFMLERLISRYYDVQDAVDRYRDAGIQPKPEWLQEWKDLEAKIDNEFRWANDPLNIMRYLCLGFFRGTEEGL